MERRLTFGETVVLILPRWEWVNGPFPKDQVLTDDSSHSVEDRRVAIDHVQQLRDAPPRGPNVRHLLDLACKIAGMASETKPALLLPPCWRIAQETLLSME